MSARTLRTGLLGLGVAVLAVAAGFTTGWTWAAPTAKPAVTITAASATPENIEPIDVLTIGTTLYNSSQRLDDVTVELDVYDSAGNRVLHERQSGVGISGDTSQAVYWVWRIPQRLHDGSYEIGITVYETETSRLLARDDSAAAFQVARASRR